MKLADLPPRLCSRMAGPRPEDSFESNGLTDCPDVIFGHDCRAAGVWHDYAYVLGGDEFDREIADTDFLCNLRSCGLVDGLARVLYRRVRFWGINHFRYDIPPRGVYRVWLFVRCFFTRYWT